MADHERVGSRFVATGAASRLRLKLGARLRCTKGRSFVATGAASRLRLKLNRFIRRTGGHGVATGAASRLRLKLPGPRPGRKGCPSGNRGGFSFEIETDLPT